MQNSKTPITDSLREQHRQILLLIEKIEMHLSSDMQKAEEIKFVLSALTRDLIIHLGIEERGFYPMLIKRGSSSVKHITQEFMEEMGHIASAFSAYAEKWESVEKIREYAEDFTKETQAIFSQLRHRIGREEAELYPFEESI